jgi:hypothetical protein
VAADPARRRTATRQELDQALKALLDAAPTRVAVGNWPADLQNLDQPGLYSWWVDRAGAQDLSKGLGQTLSPGRIYAGQTGATKWPSGTAGVMTLAKRVGANHVRGQIRGSTFRLTLAAILRQPLCTRRRRAETPRPSLRKAAQQVDPTTPGSGRAAHPRPDALADLERQVLPILNPPLNLDQMPTTPLRATLSARRASLTPQPRP